MMDRSLVFADGEMPEVVLVAFLPSSVEKGRKVIPSGRLGTDACLPFPNIPALPYPACRFYQMFTFNIRSLVVWSLMKRQSVHRPLSDKATALRWWIAAVLISELLDYNIIAV